MPSVPSLPSWSYRDQVTSAKLQQGVDVTSFLLVRPYCKVTSTVAQTLADNATTAITWNSALEDDLGMWSAGSPTRITFAYAGTYSVSALVEFAADADGSRAVSLRINGASLDGGVRTTGLAAALQGISVANTINVNAGDYLELLATITGAGNTIDTGLTYFNPKMSVLWERT